MGTAIGDIIKAFGHPIDLAELKNRSVAVDAHNILYQFLTSIRGPEGRPLMDAEGHVTSHLAGLLYRTSNLIEAGIRPIFVFDGQPHPLKKETLAKRREIRTQAKVDMEVAIEAGDLEKARMMGARAISLDQDMIAEAKLAMEYLGLPVVVAPQEGEAQAAWMVEHHLAYATVTQDYDALLFGSTRVVRNLAVTGKRKLPYRNAFVTIEPKRYELEEILSSLAITREQLIWVGMLIGTDFNEKIPKVGPKTALNAVKGKDSFPEVVKGLKTEVDYPWEKVERLFTHPHIQPLESIPSAEMNSEKVLSFYCDRHGFDSTRVTNALNKIARKPEDEKQSTLGKWG
ncbi:MAG: flap endonuclease-1 [Candidatus Diapherotrites archaeon]|nr:flap endonuclease-1 [Candidatus Diapherotrites archaeon]MDZ4256135.1 flap endonuclease-1 [archaeon]